MSSRKVTNNNRTITALFLFLVVISACAQPPQPACYDLDNYVPLLENKKVGLVVNHTSMLGNTHLVDTLLNLNVKVQKVFAPEHGFRGTAYEGAIINDSKDSKTGLPILSLYGRTKKPTPEMINDLDVLIFDIQDVGARFYTFISTMHLVMEAAAENNKKLIVLDRPNPNGQYVDGPILEPEHQSFIGMHPIPIVHGLTVGELALMINGEGWLKNGAKCDLTVIKATNYTHQSNYALPIQPSPNLPNDLSIELYPSLCLFERTEISVGRGTDAPFQQIGHPSFRQFDYSFTPVSMSSSKYPKHENETCYGIRFEKGERFTLRYLIDFYKLYEGDEFFWDGFETRSGTSKLRQQIIAGKSEEAIRESWKEDLTAYKKLRRNYLLYAE